MTQKALEALGFEFSKPIIEKTPSEFGVIISHPKSFKIFFVSFKGKVYPCHTKNSGRPLFKAENQEQALQILLEKINARPGHYLVPSKEWSK